MCNDLGRIGARGRWLALGLGALALSAAGPNSDWPQFRGVSRDGVSRETGLLDAWGASGPTEVWRRPLGEGYSAISVAGNRLFTMYAAEQEGQAVEFAAAFDAQTGKELWRVGLGQKYETQFGHGPRATPTVDGDTVYVLDSRGTFAALAVADGAERFRVSLTEKVGSEMPYWGFSTSPIVDGDHVIVEGGGPAGKAFAALDRKSGALVWTYGDGPAGYNSPLAVELFGAREFVYILNKKLAAFDRGGHELWSYPWPEGETHAMPVFVAPNRIFASGVEGVGATLLEIRRDGEAFQVAEVWKESAMRNHFSSSLVHDGHVYGFDNATLKCLSLKDGKLAWAQRGSGQGSPGFGKGSLILADGKLFVLTELGQLVLVEATPAAYREKARHQVLEGRCWTAPSLAGGRLYLRNHQEMVSLAVKG